MRGEMITAIVGAYDYAREKHPYFADMLIHPTISAEKLDTYLGSVRANTLKQVKCGTVRAFANILDCEIAEAMSAIAHGYKGQAVAECYDAIAVLLRIIDVLEGRQKLGKPKAAKKGGAR